MLFGSERRERRLPTLAALLAIFYFGLPNGSYGDSLIGITNDDNLLSINTGNPAGSTLIGTLASPAAALGIISGNGLYIYNTNANVIDQINPSNAAPISTINIGIPVTPGEGDLAFRNGVGYLASTYDASGNFNGTTGTLYKFTLIANSATVISQNIPLLDGLTFSSGGTLYGLEQGGARLYTLNPSTGAILTTQSTGINDNCGGFACYGFGGLSFSSSGKLYASLANFSGPDSTLFQVNPLTGAATQLADIPFDQVSGLTNTASATAAVPEPSAAITCAIGLIALICSGEIFKMRRAR